jgi:hypothetical protein
MQVCEALDFRCIVGLEENVDLREGVAVPRRRSRRYLRSCQAEERFALMMDQPVALDAGSRACGREPATASARGVRLTLRLLA